MKIIFITDLHIGEPGEYPFDVDVRKNFLDLLNQVQQYPYDLLVIGGDLCLKDGQSSIYKWQKEHLDALDKPYQIIAGNHDDQQLMAEIFTCVQLQQHSEIYFELGLGHCILLFLDTARKHMSEYQKSWLKTRLLQNQGKQLLIFMHHPPALMGVPFMDDAHALEDREEILQLLIDQGTPIHVFCGHYHVHKSSFIQNVAIHITPSLYVQIDQYQSDFTIDHKSIAFRMIHIEEGLRTTVHYLPGNHPGG